MYYLDIISLENCQYSNAALDLAKNKQIKYNKISVTEKNKQLYKTQEQTTYPQIYLKKNNREGSLLIGGYDSLKEITDLLYGKQLNNNDIIFTMNKYNISKKAVLRLYQLINW